MRATLLASSPAPSARARPLTRLEKQRRGGRTASSREPFLLVRSNDDVTNSSSKASISRQQSAAESQGERAPRHVSEPIGCAVAWRALGEMEAERRVGAISPGPATRCPHLHV